MGPTSVSSHIGSWYPLSVHNSVTFSYVFRLVQLNKCVVVRGSDLQMGHSGDGCLNMHVVDVRMASGRKTDYNPIIYIYMYSRGHLFVMSWARVQHVDQGVLFWSDVL